MQQINDCEWVSSCGEWTVFTDGTIRVYNVEEQVDVEHVNLPHEVQSLLDMLNDE